ncbi:flagellar hook-associated protein FlgK [Bacillus methanolicus]|uniref:flagellar hook-associated protein FlgK n=1 Tax=Bacillus methanolicus TaxID=1471 RepID=UPI00200C7D84|nr:flagellar hook-associated protein FlgK [Bacillus methanolicus]UQD53404.1 flagellar hook-associated protein FlgK [Bacillus methanolicus]
MRSTFMGLEIARRGMFTQQSALYTTGHNIANANTPGYSRQRVNFQQTTPYPSIGMNRPNLPGQMGTGVEAGSVQRIRESFLDLQYRVEMSKVGYHETLSESLTKMEEIMNEPSDSGLQSTLEKFWNSLQDLASHTENSGARDVVAASGQMVADTLNYYYNSLSRVQQDIGHEIGVKVKEINDLVSQIDKLNRQISEVEPNGYLPNDLYDERDLLVDQLSKLINIKVTNVKPDNYGNAMDIAEGLYNIEIVQEDGKSFSPPVALVSVDKTTGMMSTNNLEIVDENDGTNPDPDNINGLITKVKVGTTEITNFTFSGQLAGLIESYGYKSGTDNKGYYPEMLDKLNKMTEAFVNEFNYYHQRGFALNELPPKQDANKKDFFEIVDPANPAQSIKVSDEIKNNPSLIAAGADSGNSGDNKNAQILADLKTKSFQDYDFYKQAGKTLPSGLIGNIDTFYAGIIGKLGVDSQSAAKDAKNSQILADSVDQNRQSISSVSLDEEMTNMIKFQHAYNALARNITVIDEMLDKIINGMGIVGR